MSDPPIDGDWTWNELEDVARAWWEQLERCRARFDDVMENERDNPDPKHRRRLLNELGQELTRAKDWTP